MSEITIETINEEQNKILSFSEIIPIINDKYLLFLNNILEKFKYHNELIGSLEHDLKLTNDKLLINTYQVIDTITDNLLSCLEQISDHNSDYFIYQKESTPKKNGKVYKNKLPKIGNRTLLKRVLKESDRKFSEKIFKDIINFFNLLTLKDENNVIVFNKEYVNYVKEKFTENKNFSKMIMVFDNIDNIFNAKLDESDILEEEEELKVTKKTKNNKKKNNSKKNNTDNFMKGLENTKIAQLAKNISEKINVNDFPDLTDPSKLLSSLSNPSSDESGGIQNLLKFVVGEVEDAFKNNNLNEKDLIGEAQNIMGQFQNMSGFDPMSFFKNNENLDINQFADIFSKMKK
jgi:Mg2+ and Co2+ transporter CorA